MSSKHLYDLVIDDIDWLITCDGQNQVYRNYSIGIDQGVIRAIEPAGSLSAREEISARQKLVTPGLINSHTHLAMSLLRGWAEGVNLDGFLKRVWAAEGALMDPDTCQLGSELGALEALLSGTTTALDMYFNPESTHKGARRLGLRHIAGPIFFDFPGLDSLQWSERIEFARRWPQIVTEIGGPWIPLYLMPHSTYTDSPEHLEEVAQLAQELGGSIHLHVSESEAENKDVYERYQMSPVEILLASGILKNHTIYGHGVHLSESDIKISSAHGAAVGHCPGSNLKLGSGIADVKKLQDSGLHVGLGTDGCSSSNDLDMWQAMRMAAHLLAYTHSPADVDAAKIFHMATIDGARALGIDHRVGSIEIGKAADFISIDLAKPHLTPIHDIFALLIFAVGRSDIADVYIDGEAVVKNGRSTRVDQQEIMDRANKRILDLKNL